MDEFERNLLILVAVLGGSMVLIAAYAILSPRLPTEGVVNLIVGYQAPPILVAFIRRGLTVVCTAVITGVANALGLVEEPGSLAALATALATSIELGVWGIFDQVKKSRQNDKNPPEVAGSGGAPPNLAAIP